MQEPTDSPSVPAAPIEPAAAAEPGLKSAVAVPRAAMPRRKRWAWGTVGALALTFIGLGALLAWLWASESGARWALAQVPGLSLEGWEGELGSSRLSSRRLRLVTASGTLTLDDVELRGMRWVLHPYPGAAVGLSLEGASVGRAEWKSAAASAASPPPTSLRLPIHLQAASLRIATLQVDDLPALHELAAQLELGAQRGAEHLVQLQHLASDLAVASGKLRLDTDGPMALQADIHVDSQGQAWPWQAQLGLKGPLLGPGLQAALTGTAPVGQTAPQATLATQIRPFAAWPLGDVSLVAQALDLASLSSAAPHTRLDVQGSLQTAGLDRPALAKLSVSNATAGRWDQGLLPLRGLTLKATGVPGDLDRLTLDELGLDWGTATASAGRWTGSGQLLKDEARFDLHWQDWQPGTLDARAPALRLSGPLQIHLSQLFQTERLPQFDVKAQLGGRLLNGRADLPAATLALDASGDAQGLKLRELALRAAATEARLSGSIERSEAAVWRWKLTGALKDFDARLWWPGSEGSAWREQAQRISARLDTEAALPEAALNDPGTAYKRLTGEIQLQILPSLWAGKALSGQARWLAKGGASPRGELQLSADDAVLEAHWQDKASLHLHVPHLDALQPLMQWLPQATEWAPKAGTLDLSAEASPPTGGEDWRWQGSAQVDGLEAGTLRLKRAKITAQGGLQPTSALGISVAADGMQMGAARLALLQAGVEGSLQAHRFSLAAEGPLRPPPWFERLVALATASSRATPAAPNAPRTDVVSSTAGRRVVASSDDTRRPGRPVAASGSLTGARLSLRGSGQWAGEAVGRSAWQWQLAELALQGRRGAADAGLPWLSSQALAGALSWNAAGDLEEATVAPGELGLAANRVRWTEARWRPAHGAQRAHIDLVGELAPTQVAPLLARLQPETAWSGDLSVGGHFKLHSERGLEADILLERLGGDLNIDEDGLLATSRQQALGLTDLRLGLVVQQGHWQFTQGLAGNYVGALGGLLSVQAPPAAWWPEAGSPLEGSLSLRVANLGAWATWMPAGWRLGGELQSGAQFGGRWGAPEVSGQLSGNKLSLRNALQGVDWRDGEVRLAFDGPRARIEQFDIHGGEGTLQVSGEASLGAEPAARLQINAQRFRLLNRLDRRVVTTGQAELKLDRNEFSLNGKVGIDEGLLDISRGDAPTLADDVTVVEPLATRQAAKDAAAGSGANTGSVNANAAARKPMQLALQIDLGQQLRLKGYGLDTGLQGSLKLSNARSGLAAQGTVRAVNGNYAAYGQKLSVDRGEIIFGGPLDDPRLDIYALRPNLDVKVGVRITGTALNPRVRLASEPEMSDADKLSWLILGRAPEGLGQADTALLQRAALALLMGEEGGPADGLLSKIGLSDFNVRQATDGTVQTTVVSLGKQLSRRWYVGYERGVNATTGTWQLIYRLAQRVTVRAQSGSDSALDAIWTWRWN